MYLKDSSSKLHQCGTIQLDFNLPMRFNLLYRNSDILHANTPNENLIESQEHEFDTTIELKAGFSRPVLIHRAILGSLERMMALLTENFKGRWPFWLSPK